VHLPETLLLSGAFGRTRSGVRKSMIDPPPIRWTHN
jgi:hypothetical protein